MTTKSRLPQNIDKAREQEMREKLRKAVRPSPLAMMDAGYRKMVEIHDGPFNGSPVLGHCEDVLSAMLDKAPFSWWRPLVAVSNEELTQENALLQARVADLENTLEQISGKLGLKGKDANALLAAVDRLCA